MTRYYISGTVRVERSVNFILEAESPEEIREQLTGSADFAEIIAEDFFEALSKGYARPKLVDFEIDDEEPV